MGMTPEEAVQFVRARFPFEGYMDSAQDAYINIARVVLRHLTPGAKILDFGSGPCDKTAVIQALGFQCSAYDDLQDDWHRVPGNKDKIVAFAAQVGISLTVADTYTLPYAANWFDMVMMHDVLEHLHDSPRDLLNNLLELVRPEGYLFVTVPNAVNIRKRIYVLFGETNHGPFELYYWYPAPWRGHVREYTRRDLKSLAEYLNLKVLELRACDHMLSRKLPAFLKPVYLAVTSICTGWKDSWLLVAKKNIGWVPRKALPQAELRKIQRRTTSYRYPE